MNNSKDTPRSAESTVAYTSRLVFTDVDDTLTWQGRLPVAALEALYRLQNAGIETVLVTGACAGWCDQMARTWPVRAVIGENGAFVLERYDGKVVYVDSQTERERMLHRARLLNMAAKVLDCYPALKMAADNAYRRYDIALDHHQDNTGVPSEAVQEAVERFRALGANATASSIHINAWIGAFSKIRTVKQWLWSTYALEGRWAQAECVYVGDSLNDEALFEFFPNSVGVANVRRHWNHLIHKPRTVTRKPGGFGFAEWVDSLLSTGRDDRGYGEA